MILLTLLSVLSQFTGAHVIDGYSNQLSARPGDTLELYLNGTQLQENYSLKLFDLKGNAVADFEMQIFPQEPAKHKPYENGFGYKLTSKIQVPSLPSGVYLWENIIPLVIKSANPKIVVVYSSNTENAYCSAGGKSLYDYNSAESKRASKVSFLRPIPLPKHSEAFFQWMVNQNYEDVGYITDQDLEDFQEIKKASLLIIPGHSEYWTLQARKNFDRFVHDGKNVMVLSGNTMWWQVRYSKTKDQLICFKNATDDRIKSSKLKTINWNHPTLGYPILKSLGADFSFAGYGRKTDKGWDGYKIMRQSPLLENTDLQKGDTLYCSSDELDGAPLVGFNDDGIPVINRQALGFEKIEIVGYDLVWRAGVDGVATWVVFKPTKNSGIVINTASTDWCSAIGIGQSQNIQQITANMISKLLKKENVFSPDEKPILAPLMN